MQQILVRQRNPNLRAYFIWGPYLRSDSVDMAQAASQRFIAPNAAYYWTPTQKLARDFGAILRLAGGRLAWDIFLIYRKGTLWEGSVPEPAFGQHQMTAMLVMDRLDPASFGARVAEYLMQ